LNWFKGASFTDPNSSYPSGSTQLIWGLAAGNWDFYMDNITFGKYQEIPAISVSIDKMSGFYYLQGQGPSDYQSFNVAGNFINKDIEIRSSDNFEVSFNPFSGYDSPLVASGSILRTVYVRLKEGLSVGKYTGEIKVTSVGVDERVISVNGYVKKATGENELSTSSATIVSKEYFTLTGQRISGIPLINGIYIVKNRMEDNSIKVVKEWYYINR